jgi:hypothetical protein
VVIALQWTSSDKNPVVPTPLPTTTSRSTPSPAPPTPTDPGSALRQRARDDRTALAAVPDGYWVPQLSSKKVGLVADGVTYTEQAIWDDHTTIRGAVTGVALLWSGDYTTFKYDDYWVTVVASEPSETPDAANAWCDSHGYDRDHCYAKRISATGHFAQTTKNR